MTKKNKKQKPKDGISFDLLQNEVDDLLDKYSNKQTEQQLEKTITEKLAELLPDNETIKKNVHKIIIKNTEKKHSPFVLDLQKLIKEQENKKSRRQEVKKNIKEKTHRKSVKPSEKTHRIKVRLTKTQKPACRQAWHKNTKTRNQVVVPKIKTKSFEENLNQTINNQQFTKNNFFNNFFLPLAWAKNLAIFILICLIIILPLKGFSYLKDIKAAKNNVLNYTNTAYEDLKIAGESLLDNNLEIANIKFSDAENNFNQATSEIKNLNSVITSTIKLLPKAGKTLEDAENLLQAGKNISLIGDNLSKTFNDLYKSPEKYQHLTDKITVFQENLNQILPTITETNQKIQNISLENIPEDKRIQFRKVIKTFNSLENDLQELNNLTYFINQFLGKDSKQRYLLTFQNNNEIRATGGFLGSLALVDLDRGELTNLEIPGGGSYAFQGQFLEKIIAPEPLHLINARWELQDSNWWPDFPTSAEKIKWFFEKSGGPTVDGVVAINATIIPELLKITGPIYLEKYNKTFTSENFVLETQKAVEFEYDKNENQPKQILADLAPIILEKIFNIEKLDLLKLVNVLKDSLNNKEIQLYSTKTEAENTIQKYNWTGEIKNTSRDYLNIVNTNIGGGKTDQFIKQKNHLEINILPTGEIINNLTITREFLPQENNIFSDKLNVNYLRVYVPENSLLISADGFSELKNEFEKPNADLKEDKLLNKITGNTYQDPKTKTLINNEFNKTVFSNWTTTEPGETSVIHLKYKLPFKLKTSEATFWQKIIGLTQENTFYSLLLQKQAGQQNNSTSLKINLPKNLNTTWQYQLNEELKFETESNSDELLAILLNRSEFFQSE